MGASLAVEHRLLGVRASAVEAHGPSRRSSRAPQHRLGSRGPLAQLLHGTWDLPGLGIEPMSPALAGRFLTTEPTGKPSLLTSLQNLANEGLKQH